MKDALYGCYLRVGDPGPGRAPGRASSGLTGTRDGVGDGRGATGPWRTPSRSSAPGWPPGSREQAPAGRDVDLPAGAPVAPPRRLRVRLRRRGPGGAGSGPAGGRRRDAGGGRGRGDLTDHDAGVAARAAEGRGELVDIVHRTPNPSRARRGRGGRSGSEQVRSAASSWRGQLRDTHHPEVDISPVIRPRGLIRSAARPRKASESLVVCCRSVREAGLAMQPTPASVCCPGPRTPRHLVCPVPPGTRTRPRLGRAGDNVNARGRSDAARPTCSPTAATAGTSSST